MHDLEFWALSAAVQVTEVIPTKKVLPLGELHDVLAMPEPSVTDVSME